MEDAMILNKASFERGFAHGTVIKCEVCSLMYSCHLLSHHLSTVSHCFAFFFHYSQIVDLIKISGNTKSSSLRFGECFSFLFPVMIKPFQAY